jgi:hypothetical protein
MGRGRAKAKQTKVARELKYSSGGTDLDALRKELASASPSSGASASSGTSASSDDLDDELEDDEEDDDEIGDAYGASGGR